MAIERGVLLLLGFLQCFRLAAAHGTPYEYVLVSQPRLGSVTYIKINEDTMDAGNQSHPLVSNGLKNPMGIAVDNDRMSLFVCDPEEKKIFRYKIIVSGGHLHTDGVQYVAASPVESRGVSVDTDGTIYFTDEPNSLIKKVTLAQMKANDATPSVVYSGSSLPQVSKPGGIAADGTHIFWANKAGGTQVGSVIRGQEAPPTTNVAASAMALTMDKEMIYGVCTSQNNVFFTDMMKYIYGMKKTGGKAEIVSDILVSPRGCAWDGDGTVYLADKGGNAVYSFPSNMHTIQPAQITKMFMVEDAFGVAVVAPLLSKPPPTFLEKAVKTAGASRSAGLSGVLLVVLASVAAAFPRLV